MNTKYWIDYFTNRKDSYQDPDWSQICTLNDPHQKHALGKSLAIFQLGETGGGTRLLRFAQKIATPDQYPNYQEAIQLFIQEEQEHARLLKHLVLHLEGKLLEQQWSNSVFRRFRGVINLEFNIQVLLTAELIAEVYYGLLARYVNDPVVKDVAQKILRDEVKHIAFHHDFFRHRFSNLSPARALLWNSQFKTIHSLTTIVVWHDHQACLNSLGIPRSRFMTLAREKCRFFLHGLTKPAPKPLGLFTSNR
ncbi:MAG: ferritin-like domain-containing protein [Verrucomicrobiota bacterium]